jgi:hypothetical protein
LRKIKKTKQMKKLLLHETHALEQFKLVIRSVKKALYKPIHALLFFIALAPQVLMAQAPTFSSSPVLSIGESQTYRYLIEASDPNSDPITLSATQIPSWLTLSTELASTTFAGKQNAQNSLDGQGTSAEFNFPSRMAMDAAGNNYILEHLTQVIRKVSPAGLVTTVGQFPGTNGITVGADNNIYATSGFNINRITPAGAISTFAGSSSSGFVDATSTAASFENPQAITSDASGNIYVMDNFRLRKITTTGIVTTLAGSGTSGYINATGAVAKFEHSNNGFFALTVDASGNIYVGEDGRIRKVTPSGDVSLFSGSGEKITTGYTDGTNLDWDKDAMLLAQALLKEVNRSFRALAGRKMVQQAESYALVEGNINVCKEHMITAFLSKAPNFKQDHLRNMLLEKGVSKTYIHDRLAIINGSN